MSLASRAAFFLTLASAPLNAAAGDDARMVMRSGAVEQADTTPAAGALAAGSGASRDEPGKRTAEPATHPLREAHLAAVLAARAAVGLRGGATTVAGVVSTARAAAVHGAAADSSARGAAAAARERAVATAGARRNATSIDRGRP